MQVGDILRQKGTAVATIQPEATVAEAVGALRQWSVGALVVSADGRTIDGIVSERDIVRALGGPRRTLLDQVVDSIMTTPVSTCGPTDRVEELMALMALMTENRIRHLPVEVDGRLGGIVSIGDVVKSRLTELEHEARALEEYLHHGR
jgi:CBS domain-containing protein